MPITPPLRVIPASQMDSLPPDTRVNIILMDGQRCIRVSYGWLAPEHIGDARPVTFSIEEARAFIAFSAISIDCFQLAVLPKPSV